MTRSVPLVQLSDSIIYLSSLLSDRERPIDRYINYFGGPTSESPRGSDTPALRHLRIVPRREHEEHPMRRSPEVRPRGLSSEQHVATRKHFSTGH